MVGDYTQQVTVEQFGAMVPTATRAVGSQRGPIRCPSNDAGI